jgi:hypothetical protein
MEGLRQDLIEESCNTKTDTSLAKKVNYSKVMLRLSSDNEQIKRPYGNI